MSDQETAATLAEEVKTETAAPVNDGIVDLDAEDQVQADAEGEDGKEKAKAEEPKPEGEGEEKKKLSGAQRAKVREARLLNELQAREREIEELRARTPAAKASEGEEDKPPREEDFNGDYFAYTTAKTAYEAGKAAAAAVDKRLGAREASERETKQAEIVRERDVAHAERVEDAREVIADFDQVMEKMKGVNVRNEVIDEIKSSEHSAVLTYYLANNPDKLNALNSMSGRELAREMGRLEATVKLPEAKKATSAPAPLSRSKGGAAPSSADADLEGYLNSKYGSSRRR